MKGNNAMHPQRSLGRYLREEIRSWAAHIAKTVNDYQAAGWPGECLRRFPEKNIPLRRARGYFLSRKPPYQNRLAPRLGAATRDGEPRKCRAANARWRPYCGSTNALFARMASMDSTGNVWDGAVLSRMDCHALYADLRIVDPLFSRKSTIKRRELTTGGVARTGGTGVIGPVAWESCAA